jgi:class 3 adenylate cyclase
VSDSLHNISRSLHEHTRKLEIAVEGRYASERSDPRIRLLNDALHVSRVADLELGRLSQAVQRVLQTLQGQLNATVSTRETFERERDELNTSIITLRQQRGEQETLYEISRTLNSTLEFDEVLRLVMDRVIEFMKAERGFLMLLNPVTNELEFTIARDKKAHTIEESAFKISRGTVMRVITNRETLLSDDAQLDAALRGQSSIVTYGIRSILCAPLIVRDVCIGAVYVDSRINANLFGPKHRDLLAAFCNQAAIAIDNARLFADLNKAIRKVSEDKQYMDNIFSSIANGVITTDAAGVITTFNDAAGIIFRLHPREMIGKHYEQAFCGLPQVGLVGLLQDAITQHEHGTLVPTSADCEITGREGIINLNLYVTSLRDTAGAYIGTALVVDDRTELKRSEARAKQIRVIFERYVHPNVVQQLIRDPMALNLGGETREVSVVFADIRGYTRLSESNAPEQVMNLLNNYLEIMVKEVWDEEGTITAFMGDALMAIFNAPLNQDDHALRAVRAAWKMRMAVLNYQRFRPLGVPISFGFGVNTDLATVGNIGSRGRIQNYTAIGDAVNVASRLQSNASDNNILLNYSTLQRVQQRVQVAQMPPLYVKNKSAPLNVWCLTGVL